MAAHIIFEDADTPKPQFISPNQRELARIHDTLFAGERSDVTNEESPDWLDRVARQAENVSRLVDHVIVTVGKQGVIIAGKGSSDRKLFNTEDNRTYISPCGKTSARKYASENIDQSEIVNASGAGDCFASGFISSMLAGLPESECVRAGFKCAQKSLLCSSPVPANF